MNNCIYVLDCANGRFYIGSTVNLSNRLIQHKNGQVKSTMNIRPLTLAFSQEYSTIQQARKAERWLKKQKDKDFIKKIIKERVMYKTFD